MVTDDRFLVAAETAVDPEIDASGNDRPDAYLAAYALENSATRSRTLAAKAALLRASWMWSIGVLLTGLPA